MTSFGHIGVCRNHRKPWYLKFFTFEISMSKKIMDSPGIQTYKSQKFLRISHFYWNVSENGINLFVRSLTHTQLQHK